jgi:aldehyde dehydrogenase (NAD+)
MSMAVSHCTRKTSGNRCAVRHSKTASTLRHRRQGTDECPHHRRTGRSDPASTHRRSGRHRARRGLHHLAAGYSTARHRLLLSANADHRRIDQRHGVADGTLLGEVAEGNRKDIRNAVEAARKQTGWTDASAHNRAQVLYYIAENLSARAAEFAARIKAMTDRPDAMREVDVSIDRLFHYAAWADKDDGLVHQPPVHGITVALNEPLGVIGIVCPNEMPLLGFISLVAPALALGNRVVAIPSQAHPLSATDFYQIFDTSDVPGGALNIITGGTDELARVLAAHADVDAVWRHDGSAEGCAEVERLSAATIKRTWVGGAKGRDWFDEKQSAGKTVLAHASQVKNIWIPYGV